MLGLAGYGDATVHGTARASSKTWCDECTTYKDAVSEAGLAHIEGDKVKAAYARREFEQQRAQLCRCGAALRVTAGRYLPKSFRCAARDNFLIAAARLTPERAEPRAHPASLGGCAATAA